MSDWFYVMAVRDVEYAARSTSGIVDSDAHDGEASKVYEWLRQQFVERLGHDQFAVVTFKLMKNKLE